MLTTSGNGLDEIIVKARSGDKIAQKELYEECYKNVTPLFYVYRFSCKRYGIGISEFRSLFDEALIDILYGEEVDYINFFSYFYGKVKFLLQELIRKERHRAKYIRLAEDSEFAGEISLCIAKHTEVDEILKDEVREYISEEDLKSIYAEELEKLEPVPRMVLEFLLSGYQSADIANVTGISYYRIQVLIDEILAKLKEGMSQVNELFYEAPVYSERTYCA